MTRKPRIASRSVTHKPPPHARCPSLALHMTSLRRLVCPFNALPLRDRLFMELRSRCARSLVDCAAGGKVSESRRANMARRANFPLRRRSFAYASCSGVSVACTGSVVHAAAGATAPWRREPDLMSPETTAPPPAPAPIDGLPPELRRWAVAAIFTALAMASLDTAIANIALPAIAADLNVSPADVVWVVNIYQIALVATLLPLGALGEIVGHQRIYLGGLVLFTLASLGCALAWSLPSLTAARALQGLGASGIMSVNAALVRFVYPTRMLGRGFGHNALVVGTAFTLGPTIASAILAIGTWPWLFAINIPFGVIAIWIGLKTLPKTPRAKHSFDFASAALTASCLG